MNIEQRALNARVDLRAGDTGKTAQGYAALFDVSTDIGGYFRETIAPGAFSESLKTDDVCALIDHDRGRVIGRTSAGTLRLTEDDKGLKVEIDLPDTSDGRDLAVQLERGDISGMSFGFIVRHDEWDETVDPPSRTIHAVELMEVSAVAFPAYPDTSLALRSRERARADSAARSPAQRAADSYFRRKAATDQRIRRI